MKVYIAGPVNGYQNGNKEKFEDAEQALINLGHEPVNPTKIDALPDPHICRGYNTDNANHKYGCYMIPDIMALLACEGYTLLEGWEYSRGARVEEQVAIICGLEYVEL